MHSLDSSAADRGGGKGGKERLAIRVIVRCCCTVAVSLGASFLFSFLAAILAVLMGSFSASNAVKVPAVCKIVSSSVDIKSSRICELGFLEYKIRYVFYPKEKTTFRCHDDYYWASIFEVEFKEYFSGQILHTVSEAPKKALPQDCRPNFDAAWMTKMKFKINETYNCTYALGSQKADIYPDSLFNCQARDSSAEGMFKKIFALLSRPLLSEKNAAGRWIGYAVAGIVVGMLASVCCIILIKMVWSAISSIFKHWNSMKHLIRYLAVLAFSFRIFLLSVGFFRSIENVGLKQLYFNPDLRDQIMHAQAGSAGAATSREMRFRAPILSSGGKKKFNHHYSVRQDSAPGRANFNVWNMAKLPCMHTIIDFYQ